MFRFLTRTMRRRAGLILALSYLACVIAPPLALAFADGTKAAHCLTHEHRQAVATVHTHADGSAHHHGPPASAPQEVDRDDKSAPVQCCGLFCVTAAMADADLPFGATPRGQAIPPALEAAPGGTGPFRIDRPPNSLLSI